MSKLIVLLLAIFALSSYGYVLDIAVDVPSFQVYVNTDNGLLYEVDTFTLTQESYHNKTGVTESGSVFVGRRNNRRVLYEVVDTEAGADFVYYNLPLPHSGDLVPAKTTALDRGLSLDSVYDQKDNIALHTVSRNLTLVDLKTMTILDSFRQWVGSRRFGRNTVYNHNNKHVYTFYTHVPYRGNYGLSVDEHVIENGQFVDIDTTYNCLCREEDGYNMTESPFYKLEFSSNGCKMDYFSSPARIWCATSEFQKFYSFNSNNLTQFNIINSGASFTRVAWDFLSRVAYAISVDPDVVGFRVSKVLLYNGLVLQTYVNTELTIDPYTFELDSLEPHLYIALDGVDGIVSVNTLTMSSAKVVTLSP